MIVYLGFAGIMFFRYDVVHVVWRIRPVLKTPSHVKLNRFTNELGVSMYRSQPGYKLYFNLRYEMRNSFKRFGYFYFT